MLHEKEANIVPQTRFQLASMVRYLLLKGNSFFSISVYKHWKEKFFVEYNRFRYWQIWDIFLKVKWEKRRESTPHSLFHFTAVFIYMGRESKCENKCRFYYSFRLREIHTRNGDCGGEREKKRKKRFEGIWTWFFREVLRLTSGLPAFRGYRLLSWSGWKPYLIY